MKEMEKEDEGKEEKEGEEGKSGMKMESRETKHGSRWEGTNEYMIKIRDKEKLEGVKTRWKIDT